MLLKKCVILYASDFIEENEYLKIVHNWGEIYKYIILKEGENK